MSDSRFIICSDCGSSVVKGGRTGYAQQTGKCWLCYNESHCVVWRSPAGHTTRISKEEYERRKEFYDEKYKNDTRISLREEAEKKKMDKGEVMKQHIARQMKKMAKDLASKFESNPLYYEATYTITREESMVCEDFDAMVNKMFAEWEEKVRSKISDSNWEYIVELEMGCSLEHEPYDSKGMPLEWTVSIEWTAEAFNPFE